ncbi:MAG: hypothetical protein LBC63_02750 [Holophagales bacterium]|nr:hypothetical protein [Holophagales bacterium]
MTYLLDELADCIPSLSPDAAEFVCQLDRLGREMEMRRLEMEEIELELELLEAQLEADMAAVEYARAIAEAQWRYDMLISASIAGSLAACT